MVGMIVGTIVGATVRLFSGACCRAEVRPPIASASNAAPWAASDEGAAFDDGIRAAVQERCRNLSFW
jgi:hypothetical protein